jgi:hypothetical protein
MGRNAPPPPAHWAKQREANIVNRQAEPAPQPNRSAKVDTKLYRVVGKRAVFGVEPGETVELALTEGQVRALIEAGHIAPANDGLSPENKEGV